MGCGCNKRAQNGQVAPRAIRQTVYQVIKNGSVISEFGSLSEARQDAIAQSGQVRVSSKTI